MMVTSSPKIALVYDRVNSWGGAERVLLELHELFPDAPLFTSVADFDAAQWAKKKDVRTSWLQRIPGAKKRHRFLAPLMPLAFASFDFSPYDIVISVTSEFAKNIRTNKNQLHVCYLLTPTRYLWSHSREYLATLPKSIRPFVEFVSTMLRRVDFASAQKPHALIPISELVKKRAEKYYKRSCESVIYPPLTTARRAQKPALVPAKPFLFSWGRLVVYKRFDWILRAANALKMNLILVGEGPEKSHLQALARQLDPTGNKLQILNSLSDSEIAWYAQNARASIFPGREDFGISPLEAAAQGCPVVIHEKSGARELLTEKSTITYSGKSWQELADAIEKAGSKRWQRLDIAREARQYAGARFRREFQMAINALWKSHRAMS